MMSKWRREIKLKNMRGKMTRIEQSKKEPGAKRTKLDNGVLFYKFHRINFLKLPN